MNLSSQWSCYSFVKKRTLLHYVSMIFLKNSVGFTFQEAYFYELVKRMPFFQRNWTKIEGLDWLLQRFLRMGILLLFQRKRKKSSYSVIHISTHPSKELCSKIALGEVGVCLPRWCHALVARTPGPFYYISLYWGV